LFVTIVSREESSGYKRPLLKALTTRKLKETYEKGYEAYEGLQEGSWLEVDLHLV